MKKLFLLLFAILFFQNTFSQNAYIATDSTKTVGVKLREGSAITNARVCQLKKEDEIIKLTPYEIAEYGFKDGRVYVSKQIHLNNKIQRVFLERLQKGRLTLYFYKGKGTKTYYIERDSTKFIELPKKDDKDQKYKNQLNDLVQSNSEFASIIKYVSYSKASLSKFIERYNKDIFLPFPHIRYGAHFKYNLTKFNPVDGKPKELDYLNLTYGRGFGVGLSINLPINASDYSCYMELNYSTFRNAYYTQVGDTDYDLVFETSSFELPMFLRYTYPHNTLRPFINIGGIVIYNTTNEVRFYETVKSNNVIQIKDLYKSALVDDYNVGYSIGIGTEYILNNQHSIFFEIRRSSIYDLLGAGVFRSTQFAFIAGINI